MYMKMKTLSVLVMVALGAPLVAQAEDSPWSLSGNVSLTSNYVFRGISQTGGDPAIQGGLDLAHSSGFYVGTWGSNVGWIQNYQGYGSGNMEIDLYGGYSNSIGDFTYDVGAIEYYYPGDRLNVIPTYFGEPAFKAATANTTELYASLGWKWFTVKYSHYVSDGTFGFSDAKNSYYVDLSGSYPVGDTGLTLGAHWGTFKFKNNSDANYDDWKVSADYDLGKLGKLGEGMTLSVAYTDVTNDTAGFWTDINGKDLSKGGAFVSISKSL
jgi:uncharacterized protein (TIGR02001 family)